MRKIITILLLIGALTACKKQMHDYFIKEPRYLPKNESPLYRFHPNLSIQHDSNLFVRNKIAERFDKLYLVYLGNLLSYRPDAYMIDDLINPHNKLKRSQSTISFAKLPIPIGKMETKPILTISDISDFNIPGIKIYSISNNFKYQVTSASLGYPSETYSTKPYGNDGFRNSILVAIKDYDSPRSSQYVKVANTRTPRLQQVMFLSRKFFDFKRSFLEVTNLLLASQPFDERQSFDEKLLKTLIRIGTYSDYNPSDITITSQNQTKVKASFYSTVFNKKMRCIITFRKVHKRDVDYIIMDKFEIINRPNPNSIKRFDYLLTKIVEEDFTITSRKKVFNRYKYKLLIDGFTYSISFDKNLALARYYREPIFDFKTSGLSHQEIMTGATILDIGFQHSKIQTFTLPNDRTLVAAHPYQEELPKPTRDNYYKIFDKAYRWYLIDGKVMTNKNTKWISTKNDFYIIL